MPVAWEPCAFPPFTTEQTSAEPERHVVVGVDEDGKPIHVATVRSSKAAWHLSHVLTTEALNREEGSRRYEATQKALALWEERTGEKDPRPDAGCCGQHHVDLIVFLMEELDRLKATPAYGLTRQERTMVDAGKPIEALKMIQKRTGLTLTESKAFMDKFRGNYR